MRKKIKIIFLSILILFLQSQLTLGQTKNRIIISVGNYPITSFDLFHEIKLIAILSNISIGPSNREQIKKLALQSLIQRRIKTSEVERLKIENFNKRDLNSLIFQTSKNLGLDPDGLKKLLKKNGIKYEDLVNRYKTDLKWNSMIFNIYKNRISLNTVEIEDKIKSEIDKLENKNDEKLIETIKERIVNKEKDKKLKMFSNSHYSNLERTIQIKFL